LPCWVIEAEAAEHAAVDKLKLAELALARARKLGAAYADIRINRYRNESIFTREERVLNVSRTQDFGFGVRVLVKGAWGFAASHLVNSKSIRRITEEAVAIAKANAIYQRKPIEMAAANKVVAKWKSAFEKDPFEVPADQKVAFLLKLNEAAMQA